MQRVLITGMSGAGKSSVIVELSSRGFTAIDTDSDEWSEWVVGPQPDWIWREDRMRRLLSVPVPGQTALFVAGCKTNQGRFYDLLDHVVLLTAPLDVLLQRVATRTNNPYGRCDEERRQIMEYVHAVEPLLRKRATAEWDTSVMTVSEVADRLAALAAAPDTDR